VDIFILRHGEAGKTLPMGGLDAERPLTSAGRKEVVDVCRRLDSLSLKLDRIGTSSLKRSKETAEIAGKTFKVEVEEWAELRPEANRQDLVKKLSKMRRDSSLLLVGHEPFLSSFVAEVIGAGPGAKILLKKSGLVRISVTSFTPKMTGELRWLLSPRIMKGLR
jgi:phosphohistidine phosphatase